MNRTPLGYRGAYDFTATAEYLSCSVDVVERLVREGHLRAIQLPGMKRGRRITLDDLDAYIARASQPTLEAVRTA